MIPLVQMMTVLIRRFGIIPKIVATSGETNPTRRVISEKAKIIFNSGRTAIFTANETRLIPLNIMLRAGNVNSQAPKDEAVMSDMKSGRKCNRLSIERMDGLKTIIPASDR